MYVKVTFDFYEPKTWDWATTANHLLALWAN